MIPFALGSSPDLISRHHVGVCATTFPEKRKAERETAGYVRLLVMTLSALCSCLQATFVDGAVSLSPSRFLLPMQAV